MFDLLIHNCDVLRVDGKTISVLGQQDIGIQGRHITLVEPANDQRRQEATRVIGGSGMLAIPGLINTHCHSPMVLFRGVAEDMSIDRWFNDYIWRMEANLTAEDVYWGALLGIAEMIRNGITSVADRYSFPGQIARAVQESGIRANLVRTVFENQGPDGLARSRQFVEQWQGASDGRITAWVGPHAPYTVGPDYLRRCAHQAQQLGVGIHIHISETPQQVEQSLEQYGMTPVQMLEETGILKVPTLLGHCNFPTDDDLALLAERDVGIAQAPKTYLRYPSGGLAPVLRFRELGIPVGLASDGAASNSTLDILEAMRLMALSVKTQNNDATAMPVAEVLDIAFNGGAAVMRMDREVGRLQPGMLADIALLRQDGPHMFPPTNVPTNLVYSAQAAADVDTVICDGQMLLHNRELCTIDLEEVKREIATRLPRLLRRDEARRVAQYPG